MFLLLTMLGQVVILVTKYEFCILISAYKGFDKIDATFFLFIFKGELGLVQILNICWKGLKNKNWKDREHVIWVSVKDKNTRKVKSRPTNQELEYPYSIYSSSPYLSTLPLPQYPVTPIYPHTPFSDRSILFPRPVPPF